MSERLSDDGELAALRVRCYRGIAKVPLDALDFDHPLVLGKRRETSKENVQRLERIFERNGCLRLQEENVINAVVLDEELPALLSSSSLTVDQLRQITWARDAPSLNLRNLRCLSGLHRIEAAKRYLDDNDKWWPVRLFSAGIPRPYLTRIVESFLNEQKPSDGEIFRKIRLYHRQKDEEAENRWWACLDKSKLRDLRQLLKKKDITAAFDALIDMPGLWARVQLGALQRLLALKCDEEMIAYLRHVKRAWNHILRCDDETLPPSIIDAATVEKLESLAPSYSDIDRDSVQAMMQQQVLFPSQHDDNVRETLAANISGYPGTIPSLWTFFETLKYVEPICESLRKLLGGKVKRTIRASLQGCHFTPEKTMVQVSETEEMNITATLSKAESAHISYIELWAFCARHFDELTTSTPRMECKGTKPLVKGPNPVMWRRFALFAMSRGFITPQIKELSEDTCDAQLALEYLRKANPISTHFSTGSIEKVIAASRLETLLDEEELEPDHNFVTVERRTGRPYELDLAKDKRYLFLARLYVNSTPENINLSLVRRDLFSCMFGYIHLEPADIASVIRSHQNRGMEEAMEVDRSELEEHCCTSSNTIRRRYEILENDLKVQHQNLQETMKVNAAILHDLKMVQEECEQLKIQRSTLQEQLNKGLNLNSQRLDERANKIINLEYDNKTYQEKLLKITEALQDAVKKTEEAEEREKAVRDENNHYKERANDLQEQLNQQRRLTSEPPLLEHNEVEVLPISNALTNSPDYFAGMVSDTESHSTWTGSNTSYIVFFAVSNASNGWPKGFEFAISEDEEQASKALDSILHTARKDPTNLMAWNTLGKVVSTSPAPYLFQVLRSGTVFLGPDVVFQTFLDKRANEIGLKVPRQIRRIKRVKDPTAQREAPKNFKEIIRYESSSESMYESAADEEPSVRQRKVPLKSLAMTSPDAEVGVREASLFATTRPGDPSDDSGSDMNKEDTSFRQKRVMF